MGPEGPSNLEKNSVLAYLNILSNRQEGRGVH